MNTSDKPNKPLMVEFVISHFHRGSIGRQLRRELIEISARDELPWLLAKLDYERGQGRSVTVRPIWVERREDGMFFYDFRSFDGAPFQYIRFSL